MKELTSLKDFVEASLTDICEAVENVRQKHSYVSPQTLMNSTNKDEATNVDFDIAVTASESTSHDKGASGKAGVSFKVGVLGGEAGFDTKKGVSGEEKFLHESRIKFSVPVFFQYDKEGSKKMVENIKSVNRRLSQGTMSL